MTAYRNTFAALASLAALSACAATPTADFGLPQASAVAETFRSEMPIDPRDNGLTWRSATSSPPSRRNTCRAVTGRW